MERDYTGEKFQNKEDVMANDFGVSKEDFEAYETVRASGVTNMFARDIVLSLSGISRDVYMAILKHYGELMELYPDVRKEGE